MKKNPGRKKARREAVELTKRRGDLNRKSQHKMRTHDGMVGENSKGNFIKTLDRGIIEV